MAVLALLTVMGIIGATCWLVTTGVGAAYRAWREHRPGPVDAELDLIHGLMAGTVEPADYQRAMALLAADDVMRKPVVVPRLEDDH